MFRGVLATDLDETDVLGSMPFSIAEAVPAVAAAGPVAPPMQAASTTGLRWFLILLLVVGSVALVSRRPAPSSPSDGPTNPPPESVVKDRKPAPASAASPSASPTKSSSPKKLPAAARSDSQPPAPDAANGGPVNNSPPAKELVPPGAMPQHTPPDLQLLREWQGRM